MKKISILVLCLLGTVMLSSCQTTDDLLESSDRWHAMDRDKLDYKSIDLENSTNIEDIRYVLANNPDFTAVSNDSLKTSYNKAKDFLEKKGYAIVESSINRGVANIVSKPNEDLPNVAYIGMNFAYDDEVNTTTVRVLYGANKFRAAKLYYNIYSSSLEKSNSVADVRYALDTKDDAIDVLNGDIDTYYEGAKEYLRKDDFDIVSSKKNSRVAEIFAKPPAKVRGMVYVGIRFMYNPDTSNTTIKILYGNNNELAKELNSNMIDYIEESIKKSKEKAEAKERTKAKEKTKKGKDK